MLSWNEEHTDEETRLRLDAKYVKKFLFKSWPLPVE